MIMSHRSGALQRGTFWENKTSSQRRTDDDSKSNGGSSGSTSASGSPDNRTEIISGESIQIDGDETPVDSMY
jgi:hypothetical protein